MTLSTRAAFVSAYVSFLLDSRHRRQFSAFASGFRLVAADVALDLFRPRELQLLLVGTNLLDFKVSLCLSVCVSLFVCLHVSLFVCLDLFRLRELQLLAGTNQLDFKVSLFVCLCVSVSVSTSLPRELQLLAGTNLLNFKASLCLFRCLFVGLFRPLPPEGAATPPRRH